MKASAGCVESGGSYHANGLARADEKPIGKVQVNLGSGACPASGLLQMDTITTDISYGFTNLKPGSYCISIDPLSEPNLSKLQPGSLDVANVMGGPIGLTVVRAGENHFDVNFGWDYTDLPSTTQACTYRAAFLGDVTIPDNTITAPGGAFIKTWRLRNDGNCAWGPNQYVRSLVFLQRRSDGRAERSAVAHHCAAGRHRRCLDQPDCAAARGNVSQRMDADGGGRPAAGCGREWTDAVIRADHRAARAFLSLGRVCIAPRSWAT